MGTENQYLTQGTKTDVTEINGVRATKRTYVQVKLHTLLIEGTLAP